MLERWARIGTEIFGNTVCKGDGNIGETGKKLLDYL
jgi:hypothetical protein